jgi:hypothetical protein|tara:strand:- start:44 stop:178 length:135 start_codon:yes stop_codon:yes gene_type:complete
MNKETYENWVKIKQMLEASGKTDSFFYKRAAYIVQNGRDPGLGI